MTGPTPPQPPARAAQGNDPSMEDILASIRRILTEDETAPAPAASEPADHEVAASDDVLLLDTALIVPRQPLARPEPPPPEPRARPAAEAPPPPAQAPEPPAEPARQPPAPPPRQAAAEAAPTPEPDDTMLDPSLTAPNRASEAASSIGELVRTLSADRDTRVRQAGPTLEDLVREEIRPLLKAWLDRHLPALVERMVRAEIERVVGRAQR